jgi:N-acetylneuraminate lyase
MKMKKLKGLIAAAHTPFTPEGDIRLDLIARQADLLVEHRVSGVYVSGTTGEGVSCSVKERKALFDAWVKAAKGRLVLIAHTGALALPDAQELGRMRRPAGWTPSPSCRLIFSGPDPSRR